MDRSPPDRPPNGHVRVLLVDDDEDDYLLTRDMIAEIPGDRYSLDWISDFDTALDLICRGEFDVYLVDFRLGAKTGLDLLAAMRERLCFGPVILLTGVGQPEIDLAAEQAGAADYLEKGLLDPTLLERSIRYSLRQRSQELELERKVAERTAALAEANAALLDADRRKDEFLATLAHELRNPLAPIRNALEIMRLSGENPSGIERARRMVERQVSIMVRLIDDLLDVSRMTRNKMSVTLIPLDLSLPLELAIESTRPLIAEAGLNLHYEPPTESLVIEGDHVRLAQLFTNLLANAAKYTDAGGTISLTVEKACSSVIVRIQDTGIGIPKNMLQEVFNLFTQVDRTLNRSQSGLGIGLALVKRIAEMHGGLVTAHSDGTDHGAEFTVSLPLHEQGNCAVNN